MEGNTKEMEVPIWKPISMANMQDWLNSDTSKFDDIWPSWSRKRKELKEGDGSYKEFLDRLKRQHAIETGVVEKLYDLSEGITRTFIKEGFVGSYIGHGDTNIPPHQLMAHLKDHLEAMDFVFDTVTNKRPLNVHFIKSLHQLITKHQEYTYAVDGRGRTVQTKLLRGEYKKHPNNPEREDGTTYNYCPPAQVEPEMERLIQLYNELAKKDAGPIVESAWVHHAFTQIHPFQDGNGRVARMLASLILIRSGLFPLTIRRANKIKYIEALENADKGNPNDLVVLFGELQKKNIEEVLNWKPGSSIERPSLQEAAKILSVKIDEWKSKEREKINGNRDSVFDFVGSCMGSLKQQIQSLIPDEKAKISVSRAFPTYRNCYWYTHQIVEYAKKHDYFFNRNLPRGWFKIGFEIGEDRIYDLVVTLHHFGYDDATLAIGGFLEFKENRKDGKAKNVKDKNIKDIPCVPVSMRPYTLSLDKEHDTSMQKNIESYMNDLLTIAVSEIANEIT